MLEVDQITYTAIITIQLPGADGPATATITLTPQDAIPAGGGQVKLLRDCTLADLDEFGESLEAQIWAEHRERMLTDLASDQDAHVKITILNETGRPLSTTAADWLAHAVILSGEVETTEEMTVAKGEMAADLPPAEAEDVPVSEAAVPVENIDTTQMSPAGEPLGQSTEEEIDLPEAEAQPEPPLSKEPEPGIADTMPSAPSLDIEKSEEKIAEEQVKEIPAVALKIPEKAELRIAGLRRPLGHATPAAVDILINEPPFRDMQAHALSSMDREVAGVLVGPMPEKQPDGRYVVHITDIVIAKHTKMQGASVTYTPESWRYIHDRLGERYPNEEALIVGWYHTHPGFGIFLSGMDLFIHQNFFTQIWHVALVLDPVARRSGFFCWNRGKTAVDRYDFPWPNWLAGSW